MPFTVAPDARSAHHPYRLRRIGGMLLLTLAMGLVGPIHAAKPEVGPDGQPNATTMPAADANAAPLVRRLLRDSLTSEREKQRLRVFHGQWASLKDLPVKLEARLALQRYELEAPIWQRPEVPARLKARAALRRGEPRRTLKLLGDGDEPRDRLLRARAHQQLGQRGKAVEALTPLRQRLLEHEIDTAPGLTAGAQGLALLARLEGRPAADYHLVMRLLAKAHQQLDPLYWPAHLAEAELLLAKDNRQEAIKAIQAALELNPKCGKAWFLLGKDAAARFAFDRAAKAAKKLRQINANHPFAARVEARIALQQRQPDRARDALKPALERYPTSRPLIALKAAIEGLAYDRAALQRAFDRFDELAPGSPLAHVTAGTFLSMARQYDLAERVLREAVERDGNWPRPRVELGLLLMQMGELEAARDTLARATELDPFQLRANNQLELVKSLLGYETIETEHFIIRYQSGIDRVLARDMPKRLEAIYDDLTAALNHEPKKKTQIDLMPSESHFAVRITGMPDIWTIAASTGPVIALTPPKAGRKQRGVFNWANVIRHEFVHTVTLDRTANRLPHWFTEGVAVSMETTGRSYSDCQLLASALRAGELFDLDEINWGFIRPESPRDRPLAYAQAAWMIEYLTDTHGKSTVREMMRLYNDGVGNVAVVERVTGAESDVFFTRFQRWARRQVKRWGFAPPKQHEGAMLIADRSITNTKDLVESWMAQAPSPAALKKRAMGRIQNVTGDPAPDKPIDQMNVTAVLRAARRQLQQATDKANAYTRARRAVLDYALARPIDPWVDRALVRLAFHAGRVSEAIPSLERLSRSASRTGGWAYQLARIHREADRLGPALDAIERALENEPYNARYRELAATISLQNSRPQRALHHLRAMPALEPDEAIHHVRLAALYSRLGQSAKASKHARQAREINAEAPVDRFLN